MEVNDINNDFLITYFFDIYDKKNFKQNLCNLKIKSIELETV